MEPTQLRLLLLVLGILLILGIYFWDKTKRHRHKQEQQNDAMPAAERNEPFIEQAVAEEALDVQPMQLDVGDEPGSTELSDFMADLSFSAHGEDEFTLDPALRDTAPSKIIQLNIAAAENEPFTAQAVADAAQAIGLEYVGGVYQRVKDQDAVLFSMASMLEPGTLPADDDGFTTPGLTLFSQLPGVCDGLLIYSDMLSSAERMAALLGGTLLDETHSALTQQTVEHMREAILEHRRQIQLLKKR
jgi:cell division protein ZipA